MPMCDLSILIPARNEMFLKNTVEDILKNSRSNTEIIIVLDGQWPVEPLEVNPRVTIIYHPESIGQRAATNEAAKLASGKYLMKVDAHCAFDEGFDSKLIGHTQDDWTIVPTMRNLHAFNWVCQSCGETTYQGPTPEKCSKCGNSAIIRDVVWIAKKSPQSNSYCFDSEPHFQYFGEYSKRPEGQGELTESMSLQGSCFMISKENYWKWNVCDESFGSWGSQGIEVAFKTWANGGRVIVDHSTWYAHMFRTQGGDFGFPYPQSGKQVEHAKEQARRLFQDTWPGKVHDLVWLLEKFWPVKGWTQEQLDELKGSEKQIEVEKIELPIIIKKQEPTKGIIYYTDNRLNPKIMKVCQDNLLKINLPISSCSLQPINFGKNTVLNMERSYLTMFKQILLALEYLETDIAFFCEHDVLYHPSHFDFTPEDKETFYYNMNSWLIRVNDGHALYYDHMSLNGLCVYRETAIIHYKERIDMVEQEGFNRRMGFEPFTHNRIDWANKFKAESFRSEFPNLDLKHDTNLTPNRWRQNQFRDQRNCRNWKESTLSEVPGWNIERNILGY